MSNPYKVVEQFEEAVARYTGAPYAVAVESCTSAIFLCLKYGPLPYDNYISIPTHTYPGIACSIIHAGARVRFREEDWEGYYRLHGTNIFDAALRFRWGMFNEILDENTATLRSADPGPFKHPFICLSFHIKKLLPIGRGGMILTSDREAVSWLRKARFDGRSPVPMREDDFTMLGWNCYMQPEQAARGLALLQALGARYLRDLDRAAQGYPDLSKFKIYYT
jgi:perosamine synthetase